MQRQLEPNKVSNTDFVLNAIDPFTKLRLEWLYPFIKRIFDDNNVVGDVRAYIVSILRLTTSFDFVQSTVEQMRSNDFCDLELLFVPPEHVKDKSASGLYIVCDGYYSLDSIIYQLEKNFHYVKKKSCFEEEYSLPRINIFLKKTHQVIKDVERQKYVVIRSENNGINEEFNNANIVLNLVTLKFLLHIANDKEEMLHYLNNISTDSFRQYNFFVGNNMLISLFPYPSNALTFDGCLKRSKWTEKDKIGACTECDSFCAVNIESNDNEKNSYSLKETLHFGKRCIYGSVVDNRRILNHLESFRERIAKYDKIIEEDDLMGALRRQFPFLIFPTNYTESLFYFNDRIGLEILNTALNDKFTYQLLFIRSEYAKLVTEIKQSDSYSRSLNSYLECYNQHHNFNYECKFASMLKFISNQGETIT
jgi:hypothetical protein